MSEETCLRSDVAETICDLNDALNDCRACLAGSLTRAEAAEAEGRRLRGALEQIEQIAAESQIKANPRAGNHAVEAVLIVSKEVLAVTAASAGEPPDAVR